MGSRTPTTHRDVTSMTTPVRALIWMLVFLGTVGAAASLVVAPLREAFFANPVFNGIILGVLVVGIVVNLRQAFSLRKEVAWIEEFRANDPILPTSFQPRLLAPMARMLGRREHGKLSLSAPSMRSLLDGIRARLDESRDIAHYLTGLLIFLGLLGTFWGLLTTVGSVSKVIGGLSVGGDGAAGPAVFETLKAGLQEPLSGMGTAFSSSLFGLAGALVLGFLDLQAGHAQNRFFNELEEWMSGITRLSAFSVDGEGTVPAYVQALLEKTADSLDRLQRELGSSEQERRLTSNKIIALADQLAQLTDQMRTEMQVLRTLADNQAELRPVLRRLADESPGGLDEASRSHLRNLDVGVSRIHDEARAGMERLVQELRDELRVLSRTIAATVGSQPPGSSGL